MWSLPDSPAVGPVLESSMPVLEPPDGVYYLRATSLLHDQAAAISQPFEVPAGVGCRPFRPLCAAVKTGSISRGLFVRGVSDREGAKVVRCFDAVSPAICPWGTCGTTSLVSGVSEKGLPSRHPQHP